MNKVKRLFFDIETKVNPDALEYMPEPKAPGNLKDPEKIAAAIAEKKNDWIEGAPLDADYGKIEAIAWSEGVYEDPVVAVVKDDITEARIIAGFWKAFERCGGNCVGYNILSFDLPYLIRRSFYYGIKTPRYINLAKFRTEPVTDLFAILYNWAPGKSLKFLAKRYDLINLVPDLDGAHVKDMDTAELGIYVKSDLYLTIQLFMRMNGSYLHFPDCPEFDYSPRDNSDAPNEIYDVMQANIIAIRDALNPPVPGPEFVPDPENGGMVANDAAMVELSDAIKSDINKVSGGLDGALKEIAAPDLVTGKAVNNADSQ